VKSLKDLITGAYPDFPKKNEIPDIAIQGLECDSRKVGKDFLFVAIQGAKADGNAFIAEAISRGAAAIVADKPAGKQPIPFILVPECRLAMAKLATTFYGNPAKQMKLVGITGTNGKTTSSYLIEHFLIADKKRVGVIGTVNYRFAGHEIPAQETTPGPLRIQEILSRMVEKDCHVAVMEVSSHALDQKRVEGIDFQAALFTNLTQDHLDYHKTIEKYFECKALLFSSLKPSSFAVINNDDAWSRKLKEKTAANVISYGISEKADLRAENIRWGVDFTEFDLVHLGGKMRVHSPLAGVHNIYNVLGALGVVKALGLDFQKVTPALKEFKGVPGRLEQVKEGQSFPVFIDFAHTPDGLQNVLKSLKPYKQRKLILVFGCGGERDRDKRPKMAKVASQFSDLVIVTSDNPRTENAKDIAEEIKAGFPKEFTDHSIILDRRKAIRHALLTARSGDIVLLAGKGHEKYQIIGTEALPFSDKEEAKRVLNGR
jgi:UDP-N-acetylmuramoyl-L-alanyl-D-glutamate--2,6-diaminopimelate ligase